MRVNCSLVPFHRRVISERHLCYGNAPDVDLPPVWSALLTAGL
jgi:hypothetical protein